MEGRESMGLMMPNIMTADLMLRTVSILTQRGRNLMSIGTDIRVIVCRMMKTKEQDLLLPKWRRHIMLKNIQIMWTDRMKEIERQGTMTGRRSARYSYNFQSSNDHCKSAWQRVLAISFWNKSCYHIEIPQRH